MSQQPPEWWSRQRGPRIGCADVTIVSLASITAFVVLIFLVLRPDFLQTIVLGTNSSVVSVVRPTETPAPIRTPAPPPVIAAAATNTPPPPTAAPTETPVPPTPSFKLLNVRKQCRMRQEPSYNATVVQVFNPGIPFKIYNEERVAENDRWAQVEPNDNSNRIGWMVISCFTE